MYRHEQTSSAEFRGWKCWAPWSRVPGGCEHSVVSGMHSGPLEEQCMILLAKPTLQIILFISDGLGWTTFTRGERKAVSTLRHPFWKGTIYQATSLQKPHCNRDSACPHLLKSPFKDTISETTSTSWVLTKKKILFLFALNRGNPQNAGILTNFYKEFIYVYCIFCAGLYKDGMNGISVVLSISLHDFSGRQQLLIRGSVP